MHKRDLKDQIFHLPQDGRLFVFNYVNLILSGFENYHRSKALEKEITDTEVLIQNYIVSHFKIWPITFSNFPIGQTHVSEIINILSLNTPTLRGYDKAIYFFQLGSCVTSNQYRLIEMILKVSSDLESALRALTHYYNLINPNHFVQIKGAQLRLLTKSPEVPNDRFSLIFEISWINTLLHRIFKINLIAHKDIIQKKHFLALSLTKEQLKIKSAHSDHNLEKILHFQARDTLKQLYGFDYQSIKNESFGLVIKYLVENIHTSKYALPYLAGHLGLGQRTLQRKLDKEGIKFIELTQFLRSEMAKQMLQNSFYKVTEIAQQLGYSESSAFNRAFKKWEGISPLKYRNKYIN